MGAYPGLEKTEMLSDVKGLTLTKPSVNAPEENAVLAVKLIWLNFYLPRKSTSSIG